MSRIGKQLIKIPTDVSIKQDGDMVIITGAKGVLTHRLLEGIKITIDDQTLTVTRSGDSDIQRARHGLTRSLIQNKIIGVSEGFSKKLEINGVGYRATLDGSTLSLNLGYSHPILVQAVDGIEYKVDKNVITISGIDNVLVGEVAAKIRSHRKPEPYKGKGIRYQNEKVRRKAGKTAKA